MTREVREHNHFLFPAYAGVIPMHRTSGWMSWTFPRIRGGDPTRKLFLRHLRFFSPHARG